MTAAENGMVSPTGIQSVNYCDSILVTAKPNAGYTFVNWTITDGASNIAVRTPNAPNTWVVVTGPSNLQANFNVIVPTKARTPKTPRAFDLTVSGNSVKYAVPAGKQGLIKVKLMEMNGKLITERVSSANSAGYFRLGLENLRKGCYVCTMKAGNFSKMVKVVLVK